MNILKILTKRIIYIIAKLLLYIVLILCIIIICIPSILAWIVSGINIFDICIEYGWEIDESLNIWMS